MQTIKQLNELFDSVIPAHPECTSEEKAAARVLHAAAVEWSAAYCLLIARRMLAAAKDAEMTPFFEQHAPKAHVSINPGTPTDFPIY
ncbi:hypothetical protein J8F10_24355 [Gemmata sp. G18]|uniref:Uncharacterized protein n=1 Tax=Gemmata palustris TaxID=2822762 RepID=A0ABS5BXF3_9BACT|nr:hypothetical protein [Gemmata palustris]MBP3958394.1 hypothetical protein [Gemmata palustris]